MNGMAVSPQLPPFEDRIARLREVHAQLCAESYIRRQAARATVELTQASRRARWQKRFEHAFLHHERELALRELED